MTSAPQRATLLCVAGIVLLALPTVVTSRIAAEPDLGSPVQDVRQGLADGSGTKAAVAAEAALHHRRLLQAEGARNNHCAFPIEETKPNRQTSRPPFNVPQGSSSANRFPTLRLAWRHRPLHHSGVGSATAATQPVQWLPSAAGCAATAFVTACRVLAGTVADFWCGCRRLSCAGSGRPAACESAHRS
jgi:hypothetical protein